MSMRVSTTTLVARLRRPRQALPLGCLAAMFVVVATARAAPPVTDSPAERSRELFLEAWEVTRSRFFDRNMRGVDWPAVRDELLPIAENARGRAAIGAIINRALDRLGVSHTRHYTRDQREYYELLDVFFPDGAPGALGADQPGGPITYIGAGLVTRQIDGKRFVLDIYPGGPADGVGIRIGDELLWVEAETSDGDFVQNSWSDVSAFRSRENRPTRIGLQRSADLASAREVTVIPRRIQPRKLFLTTIETDARIITGEEDCRTPSNLAYIRVRSYAHASYQEAVLDLLGTRFRDCDGLIFDLRGGWGGARAEYLHAFNTASADMQWKARDDADWHATGGAAWTKPMVVIIDSGTRSGKEMLAHALKTSGRARIVGQTTAGAVLGGAPHILADGSLLLIAVTDVLVNGVRLEGVGVEPHVQVDRPLPYCDNADPQLDAAVTELLGLLPSSK